MSKFMGDPGNNPGIKDHVPTVPILGFIHDSSCLYACILVYVYALSSQNEMHLKHSAILLLHCAISSWTSCSFFIIAEAEQILRHEIRERCCDTPEDIGVSGEVRHAVEILWGCAMGTAGFLFELRYYLCERHAEVEPQRPRYCLCKVKGEIRTMESGIFLLRWFA
jgi:hypothetical protein